MKQYLKALLGFNIIATSHLFRLEPLQFIDACRRAFSAARQSEPQPSDLYAIPPDLYAIPQVRLDAILGDRTPTISLPVMRYEDGMINVNEAMALLAILVAENPTEVLEIGTYMGKTTKLMATNLDQAIIHTVDLPLDYQIDNDTEGILTKDDFHLINNRIVGKEFRGQPCEQRIRQHFADTARWSFQDAGNPTFFFIDGSHTYEYCKNDSEMCLALCNGRGVFLWHDCNEYHPYVLKFILEWIRTGRKIVRISGTSLAYWKSAE